jgi:predicted HNH restriction endonuclease
MSGFPGKVTHGPFKDGNQWTCLCTAVMPCGTTINGTASGSERKAQSRAENLCDQSIRGHLASCKVCPESFKQQYG